MTDDGHADQLIEQFLDPAQVLWRNLCLLGLQMSEVVTSTMAKTTFDIGPDMFLHGSNFKAQNMVLFFLFHRLDPAQATKNFSGVWPIFDQRQDQEFRATVLKLLNELEKKGDIPRGTVQRSYLSCGFGTRLINLLWRFSEYVLHQVFQRDFPELYKSSAFHIPDSSKMSLALLSAHVGALEGRFFQENDKLLQCIGELSYQSERLQSKSDSVAQFYRDTLRALEQARDSETYFDQTVSSKESFSEIANIERNDRVERLAMTWTQFHSSYCGSKSGFELVGSVLSERVGAANRITSYSGEDSKDKSLVQKDINLQECVDDFVNFLPMLSSSDFLNSDEAASVIELQQKNTVAQQVSLQYSQLQCLRDILPRLSTDVDSIKLSVAGLKTELQSSEERQNLQTGSFSRASSPEINRMGLVPPTPAMSKPLLPPFTQSPARSQAKLHPGDPLESAVKKITFSAKKPSRNHLKCPLPIPSPCTTRKRP